MSCTKCKSSPCACADHGLTTPCTYTDCSTGETCEEVVCEECVRNCGNQDFRIDDTGPVPPSMISPGKLLTVMNNEPLAMTLQKIYLFLENPPDAREDSVEGHAVYYVYFTDVTKDSITVNFTGWSSLAEDFAINVSTDDGVSYAPFGAAIPSAGAQPTVSVVVTGLIAVTDYVIKVSSRFINPTVPVGSTKDSVRVHTKTLL